MFPAQSEAGMVRARRLRMAGGHFRADCDESGMATLSLRNKFSVGDEVEIVGPDCKPFTMTVPVMHNEVGEELDCPRTPQMVFTMQLPKSVPAYSFVRHAVELSGK